MKTNRKVAAIFFMACASASAQVVPEAIGPIGPPGGENFTYSLSYSQVAYLYSANANSTTPVGTNQGNQSKSVASGDLDYFHPSERHPLSVDYAGGYIWPVYGPNMGTGVFQRGVVSQGFIQERWKLFLSDNVDDTPAPPTVGFSGVAGTGEPIGTSGPASSSPSSILTINTRLISNLAAGELEYTLNRTTNLTVGGGSDIVNFPSGGGLNTEGELGNAGITKNLSARTALLGGFIFSHFGFGASPYSQNAAGSFNVNAGVVGVQYLWSRQIKMDLQVGPEWTSASNSALVPATADVRVNAYVTDQFRGGALDFGYNRGIEGGAGYLPSAEIDAVTGGYSQKLGRATVVGVSGSYQHFNALQSSGGATNAEYGGAQVSQRIGRYLNLVAGYTAIHQSQTLTGSASQSNVLNGLYHDLSFGIAFAPRGEPFIQ